MQADKEKVAWDDKIKVLLLPFIIGGAGMGGYTGYVLKASLDAEIEARRSLEKRIDQLDSRISRQLERIEDRISK